MKTWGCKCPCNMRYTYDQQNRKSQKMQHSGQYWKSTGGLCHSEIGGPHDFVSEGPVVAYYFYLYFDNLDFTDT